MSSSRPGSGPKEIGRLKLVYAQRDRRYAEAGAHLVSIGDFFLAEQRALAIVNAFREAGISQLGRLRVLDFGCGRGRTLSQFLDFGVPAPNLYGVDVLLPRLERAAINFPSLHWVCADGQQLPFGDASFDLVTQFTAFSSILDEEVRSLLASEMLRVVKPKGLIVWYDFFYDNPKNPDVRGVSKREVRKLFPACKVIFKRVTLAPPLARALAPHSWLLCCCLSALGFLNTHYLALIRVKE